MLLTIKNKRQTREDSYLAFSTEGYIDLKTWMLVICSSVLCSVFKHGETAVSLISPRSCLKVNTPYCMQVSYPHIPHHPLSAWSLHHISLSTENCLVYLHTGGRHRWYCSPRIRQRLSSKIITKKITQCGDKHCEAMYLKWSDLTFRMSQTYIVKSITAMKS